MAGHIGQHDLAREDGPLRKKKKEVLYYLWATSTYSAFPGWRAGGTCANSSEDKPL